MCAPATRSEGAALRLYQEGSGSRKLRGALAASVLAASVLAASVLAASVGAGGVGAGGVGRCWRRRSVLAASVLEAVLAAAMPEAVVAAVPVATFCSISAPRPCSSHSSWPPFFCVLTNPFSGQYAPVHFSRKSTHLGHRQAHIFFLARSL